MNTYQELKITVASRQVLIYLLIFLSFLRFSSSCPLLVGLTFYDSSPSICVTGIILRQIQLTQVLLNILHPNLLQSASGSGSRHFHLHNLSQHARSSPSLLVSKPSQPALPQTLKQGLHTTPARQFIRSGELDA